MIKKNSTTTKTYSKSNSNQEPNNIKFKFSKSRIIAETEKTVLVYIGEYPTDFNGHSVWLAKRLLYKSDWSSYISAYIPEGFTFPVENVKTEGTVIDGPQLKELISVDYL